VPHARPSFRARNVEGRATRRVFSLPLSNGSASRNTSVAGTPCNRERVSFSDRRAAQGIRGLGSGVTALASWLWPNPNSIPISDSWTTYATRGAYAFPSTPHTCGSPVSGCGECGLISRLVRRSGKPRPGPGRSIRPARPPVAIRAPARATPLRYSRVSIADCRLQIAIGVDPQPRSCLLVSLSPLSPCLHPRMGSARSTPPSGLGATEVATRHLHAADEESAGHA